MMVGAIKAMSDELSCMGTGPVENLQTKNFCCLLFASERVNSVGYFWVGINHPL